MNTATKTETFAVAATSDSAHDLMPAPGGTALILDSRHFTQMMAVAEIMAKGISTVPRHLQKNTGDCLAVVMQAAQWGMNPFAVAQKTHVVSGTLGYEAQLVNAVVNTMSPTKDRINYEWFGEWKKIMGKFEERESKKKVDEDTGKALKYRVPNWSIKDEEGLGVRVWATMKGENEPRVLELLLVQARTRNSPLWADDPRQQLAYLAVKRWTRLHCPDVLLGVYTPDELDERPARDMGQAEVVEEPTVDLAPLLSGLKTIRTDADAAAFWKTHNVKFAKQPDDYQTFKEAVIAHRKAIKERNTVDNATQQKAAPAPTPAPAPAEASYDATSATDIGPGKVTFANVMDMLVKAKNADALDVAADWIGEVADEGQRRELSAKYDALRADMAAS